MELPVGFGAMTESPQPGLVEEQATPTYCEQAGLEIASTVSDLDMEGSRELAAAHQAADRESAHPSEEEPPKGGKSIRVIRFSRGASSALLS